MQQPCQQCGYESPASARFCRQCGATLIIESELSGAATRNYGNQEPAPTVTTTGSGHLPPSVADAIAGETERYYRAPLTPTPPILKTAPIKTTAKPWRWIVLLLILFIGLAMGAALTTSLQHRRPAPMSAMDRARQEMEEEERRRQEEDRRRQDEHRREAQDQRREIENRLRDQRNRERDALNQQREAFNQARQASEQASRAGAALSPTNERLLDLNPYEYPNATVRSSIRIPGHELLTMRTTDKLESLIQFYQKKFGEPIIRIDETWEKRLVFQSPSVPLIAVSIETDEEYPKQLRIMVLRSPFRNLAPVEP